MVVRNNNKQQKQQQQQKFPNPRVHPSIHPSTPNNKSNNKLTLPIKNPTDSCNPSQYAGYCAGQLLQCSGGVCDFFSCADDLDCGELPNTFCNGKFGGCTWPGGEYLTDAQKQYYHRWGEKYGNDTSGGEGHPLM